MGRLKSAIDVSPDLFGTLEMHAYVIPRSGRIMRDTRIVLVEEADDLALTFAADKDEYRPGETAVLDINVTGEDGSGAASAIGMAIVDESVFALAEQDPGFAKLYFLLEQELLQPKYDLHGFSVPELLTTEPVLEPELRTAQEGAAKASLAEASRTAANFSLQGNSHDDAVEFARERQENYFTNLSTGLFLVWLLVPMAMIIISVIALRREKQLWGSIGLAFGLMGLLVVLGFATALGEWLNDQFRYGPEEVVTFLLLLLIFLAALVISGVAFRRKNRRRSRIGLAFGFMTLFVILGFTGALESFFEWLFWYGPDEGFVIVFLLLLLVSFITLIAMAWRRKDSALGWLLGLLIPFVLLLAAMGLSADEARLDPEGLWLVVGIIAAALVPLALLMRAAGFLRERRWGTAIAATFIGLFTIVLPIAGISSIFAMGGSQDFLMEDAVMMEMAAPMAANEADFEMADGAMEESAASDEGGAAAAGEPPRLRQFFPETMYWLPDGETDANGQLTLDIPVADSITTWRLTALASTQDGRLGSATGSLRVFQDFFIDLDLPLALTVGDEIAVPVGVFNYLPEAQTVTLTVAQDNWFELLDDAEKSLTIEPNDITVVYFRIKANEFGMQPFQVTAIGSQMSDAIRKSVRVFPNGKEIRGTHSDRLTPDVPVTESVFIPEDAIPGTQGITVKIYPGVVSQVVEGLDSILRMPNGCFEQTSSTTYPNVLVLDYLKTSGQASPEVQFKAEDYINIGYQRLTTFEVSGGGFSLFGNPPSDRMLTAYGLQEFADMSRVHDVDPQMIERAANWLLSEQMGNGSWENDQGLVHESTWSNLQNDNLPVTAYIVWSLIEAGFGDHPGTQAGLSYIREHVNQADDAYVLALVANALAADTAQSGGDVDGATQRVLDQLAGMAVRDGKTAVWNSGVATFIGSEGATGSIETTALAALAFLRVQVYPDLTNEALTALIQQKDSFGTWYNTQSTVLALKALIATVRSGAENVNATVTVQLNSGQTRTVEVTPETFDVVQLVTFDDVNLGDNVVSIDVQGEGNLMYQVTNSFYLPWDVLQTYPEFVEPQELVTIDVSYDRTELVVDDSVTVDVTVMLNEEGARTDWALIDLGIPPGFAVNTEDLTTLVEASKQRDPNADVTSFERFELTGRQVLVYLGNLQHGKPFSFSYRLTAKFPLRAQTPASNAYDYYNPDVSGEAQPQEIVVIEG
jgi:MFS family permease